MAICQFCGKSTPEGKFCEHCGGSLEAKQGESAQNVPLAFQLQEKILKKKEELKDANSNTGPIILGVLGVLTLSIYIGILFIIGSILWYKSRHDSLPKLQQELALLESQLKEVERK